MNGEVYSRQSDCTRYMGLTYARMADEVSRYPKGRILDWGAGQGEMAVLLRERGWDVTAYDIYEGGPETVRQAGIHYVKGGDKLPFGDASFDAVLSCGVLEHVDDDRYSLSEIRRILGPGGTLFVFDLPRSRSYMEFIGRHTGLGGHLRTYSRGDIVARLGEAGFRIGSLRKVHMLPHRPERMFGAPARWVCENLPNALAAVDRDILERIPLLNEIANEWEIVAVKAV